MKKPVLLYFSLFIYSNVLAVPSGNDLLNACEISLEEGFQGSTGMMCEWYVTPCDCHYGKDSEIPRVCLPERIETELLAKEVIEGFKQKPELLIKPAELSAAEILVKKYPCD
jgi:Ssp1 endopeptidase immunity protein Rap1a